MKEWQLVVNYIPIGKEKPISRAEIKDIIGWSDRDIRKAIEEARKNGVMIVSSSSRKGYYIADNPNDWEIFLHEMKGRIKTEIETYKKCSGRELVIDAK